MNPTLKNPALFVLVLLGLVFGSCSKEERDKAADDLKKAGEKTSTAMKEAGEKAGEAAGKVGEMTKDGAQAAADKTKEALDNAGEAGAKAKEMVADAGQALAKKWADSLAGLKAKMSQSGLAMPALSGDATKDRSLLETLMGQAKTALAGLEKAPSVSLPGGLGNAAKGELDGKKSALGDIIAQLQTMLAEGK